MFDLRKAKRNGEKMSVYVDYGTEYLSRRLREHRCRLGLALAYVSKVDISVKDLE